MTSAHSSYRSLDSEHHLAPQVSPATSGAPVHSRPRSGQTLSAGSQSRSPSASSDLPPSSMNVPISYYDPGQTAAVYPNENEPYQQWVQIYYAQSQAQEQYGHPVVIPSTDISQSSYSHPVGSSSHEHPPAVQNRYIFVEPQYTPAPHQRSNGPAFVHQFASPRTVDRGAAVPPRISRQVSHSNNMNRNSFRSSSESMISMGYPQAQTQRQYQDASSSVSYFPTISNVSEIPGAHDYTFSFQGPSIERATPASVDTYTPNSETDPLPGQNISPSSWPGNDESAPQHNYVASSTAVDISPQTSRRDAPTKRKNAKRPRRDTSVEPLSGSEDEGGPQPAVPPLRGPDANPARL
jgi:hypothetical protein